MSRKLVAALFTSVDGVVQAPNTFQFDSFDERMGELMGATLGPVEDVLMGRVTYAEWAAYWPPMGEQDFGGFINPVRKHVASRTLTAEDMTWANSRLVEGDLHEYVRRLKAGPGGDISIAGSVSVVRELFLAGLVDELTLMIHPVIAGAGGRRLFDADEQTTRLELLRGETTPAGNALLTYGPRA